MSCSIGLAGHYERGKQIYWTVEIDGSVWRTKSGRLRRFKTSESASNAVSRHLRIGALEPRP